MQREYKLALFLLVIWSYCLSLLHLCKNCHIPALTKYIEIGFNLVGNDHYFYVSTLK